HQFWRPLRGALLQVACLKIGKQKRRVGRQSLDLEGDAAEFHICEQVSRIQGVTLFCALSSQRLSRTPPGTTKNVRAPQRTPFRRTVPAATLVGMGSIPPKLPTFGLIFGPESFVADTTFEPRSPSQGARAKSCRTALAVQNGIVRKFIEL